jgi:hypothetical protein
MKKLWIRKIFVDYVLLAITLIALTAFILQLFLPVFANKVLVIIMPLFVAAICPMIYFMRETLCTIHTKVSQDFTYQSFTSGEDFDNYLANRFKEASSIKVIHINAQSSGGQRGRRYDEIVEKFVKSGKIFRRIFSDTSSKEVYRWIRKDLERFQEDKYFIHLIDKIKIEDIRTIGIMIIDDDEVCLGGGYKTSFTHPTIAIKSKNIVKFFSDYFTYLRDHSNAIRSDNETNWEILDKYLDS